MARDLQPRPCNVHLGCTNPILLTRTYSKLDPNSDVLRVASPHSELTLNLKHQDSVDVGS